MPRCLYILPKYENNEMSSDNSYSAIPVFCSFSASMGGLGDQKREHVVLGLGSPNTRDICI